MAVAIKVTYKFDKNYIVVKGKIWSSYLSILGNLGIYNAGFLQSPSNFVINLVFIS